MTGEKYKVLGELADADGSGILGHNTATSGTPVGVEGRVGGDAGYGLYTGDDARVGGRLETTGLGAGQADIDELNGVGCPDPADGGQGILDALESYDKVVLRPGVYETDQEIVIPSTTTLVGAGNRRDTTVIRATSSMPAVLSGRDGQFDIHTLRAFEVDGNGLADHCLRLRDSNLDFVIKHLTLRDALKDGLRLIGVFNGLVEKCQIEKNGRDGVVFGDSGNYRTSSITLHKCYIRKNPKKGINLGGQRDTSKYTPGIEVKHCDCSDAKFGAYVGRHGFESSFRRADFEKNEVGLKIGDSTMESYRPNTIDVVAGSWSNNETNVQIGSGEDITLVSLGGNGSTDGLVVDANAGGRIFEQHVAFDGPTTRDTETASLSHDSGTKVPANRLDLAAQDLTGATSTGPTDYRHHDGSSGSPEGLYRGDGSGGWVKVEDNSVTIG